MIWTLVETICRALEPEERQAVLGDLAESRETASAPCCPCWAWLARRQLALWTSWRPWVASLGLLPILLGFSYMASSVARIVERYPWANVPQSPRSIVTMLCVAALLTAVCSWAVGFVAASLGRRAAAGIATVLTAGAILVVILQQQLLRTTAGQVFAVLLPLALNLAPFAFGLHRGIASRRLTPGRGLLLAAAALSLKLLLLPLQWPSANDLLIYAFFSWPMLYLLVTARWRVPSVN